MRNLFRKWSLPLLAAAFALSGAVPAGAAGIWSSPTYTEQWSTPEYTERWSENSGRQSGPIEAIPWMDLEEILAPPPPDWQPAAPAKTQEEPPIYIRLQIGSKEAVVGSAATTLDAPPAIVNGRTMVPFRFLGEALRASVDWNDAQQQITLTQGDRTIVLRMGKTDATVSGRSVTLDAPPVNSGGRTLVPLRFVGENLDLSVSHDPATNMIEIRGKNGAAGGAPSASPGTSGAAAPNQGSSAAVPSGAEEAFEPITDFEQLYGDWNLWTPGGATHLYYKDTGNYATHVYDAGANQGSLTIRTDGTYTMDHALWGKAEGKWRLTFPREINGEVVIGIVLQDGAGGYDWAVAPSSTGKVRLLSSWGTWADGSSSWLFDTELYRP